MYQYCYSNLGAIYAKGLLSGDLGKISSIEETAMFTERCFSSSEMKARKFYASTRFLRYHFAASHFAACMR